ncbi:MAG: B12-binding domain-containing radical SAM protein [Deltaproteobacteria bacterium]|nr:B12-binding domain-containing radical SAM protein [Deltaproteobacteria bacterium]
MAKILLINPVVREESEAKHIPYGLALMAAVAQDKGHQVSFYDENAQRLGDEIIEKVCQADDWDVIGIGGLTTTYRSVKKIIRIIKRTAPNALLVAGGGFITSMPREIMEWLPQLDLAVIGEGYVTWPEVLEQVDRKDFDFSKTLGVCYRDQNKVPRLTGVRPNIKDMDVLPYPAFDLLPLDIYFANSKILYSEEGFTSKKRLDLMGSLGCSLFCKFCWHLGTTGDMLVEKDAQGEMDVRFTMGRNIRYHSPKYVVEMTRHVHEKYGVDFISFIDENFMTMDVYSKRTWLFELCNEWVKAGLQPTCRRDKVPHDENCKGVHWSGTSHAGLVRRETLDAMYVAGCSHLVYGLESFDPKILSTLGKGANQQKNIDCVGMTLDAGIRPIPNVIIGFPEESFDSVRTMIKCLLKLGIYAKPHFATPYPGSEWYYTYKDSIIEQYNGDLEAFIEDLGDASKICAVISHRFSGMQLMGLQQIVHQRDLRLLDQAEKHWADCDAHIKPVAKHKESFNFLAKAVKAPMEAESRPL